MRLLYLFIFSLILLVPSRAQVTVVAPIKRADKDALVSVEIEATASDTISGAVRTSRPATQTTDSSRNSSSLVLRTCSSFMRFVFFDHTWPLSEFPLNQRSAR